MRPCSAPGGHLWHAFVISGVKHRDCANCGRIEHRVSVVGSGTWAPGLKEFTHA